MGAVQGASNIPGGIHFKTATAQADVTAITDTIFRIRATAASQFSTLPSWAVIAHPATPQVTRSETPDYYELRTTSLTVRISKSAFAVTVLDSTGHVLSQDASGFAPSFHGQEFRVWKTMPGDENYFGLGDKPTSIDHRNQAFTMWNTDAFGWQESTDPLYKSIPFFMAMRGNTAYGIFLDNTWRTNFDFGKESRDRYSFGSDGGDLDYYFIYGPSPKQVVEDYALLTGKPPLPPLWSLGYQQCRYSYYPESRVREIANTFRAKKIPADVIYLDIDYQQGYAPFTINRQYFPHFEQMISDLGKQGFSVIAITDLHLKKQPGYKPYDEGLAGDDFVKNPDGSIYVGKVWPGDSVFPDFTLTRVRDWWGTLYKDFVAMGIKGFWNDMNEPAVFTYPDKTMPLDTRHRMDDGSTLDHRAIHNVYGMENSRATYDGLLKLKPNERPNVLTRATYAGGQRYAASWTGDNSSTWNHLRMTMPSLLNLGISGFPMVGNDVGGFNGSPTPDLLTRWIELGTFTPIFRNHTMKGSFDQEPWVHGPVQEAIRKRYIEERYRLMPYIYTSVEETSRTGLPLMRPLFMEFPADRSIRTNGDEFMFGPDLLVAPKTLETLDDYDVTLPTGDWFDFWSGAKVTGNQVHEHPQLDVLPVFVRAGSILPMQNVVQNTQEIPQGPLQIRIYPGSACRGSLYMDDGHTFNFKHGQFLRIGFTCQTSPDGVSIIAGKQEGDFTPWFKQVEYSIFGVDHRPSAVTLNGVAQSGWSYDSTTAKLTLLAPYKAESSSIHIVP